MSTTAGTRYVIEPANDAGYGWFRIYDTKLGRSIKGLYAGKSAASIQARKLNQREVEDAKS